MDFIGSSVTGIPVSYLDPHGSSGDVYTTEGVFRWLVPTSIALRAALLAYVQAHAIPRPMANQAFATRLALAQMIRASINDFSIKDGQRPRKVQRNIMYVMWVTMLPAIFESMLVERFVDIMRALQIRKFSEIGVAITPRRVGKSTAAAYMLLLGVIYIPRFVAVIYSITLSQALEVLNNVKQFAKMRNIRFKNDSHKEVTFEVAGDVTLRQIRAVSGMENVSGRTLFLFFFFSFFLFFFFFFFFFLV